MIGFLSYPIVIGMVLGLVEIVLILIYARTKNYRLTPWMTLIFGALAVISAFLNALSYSIAWLSLALLFLVLFSTQPRK